jgi:threonine dehydrogenase-like Zn-dependent dehydrogenase
VRAVRRVNQELFLDQSSPEPEAGAGQALIRPTRVLIGESDLGVARGDIEHEGVLGHQFVGVVEACDDPKWTAKRVVGQISISDPASELARRGLGSHDPERSILGLRNRDGCLADRFVLETRNLIEVPDPIDDEQACLTQSLARAIHAGQIAHIEGRPFVSVLGEGLLGLLCAQIMSSRNASVRLLSGRADRLELCAKWGIKHRHIDQVGRRGDQDVIIETTATPEGLDDALRMVRPLGTVVLAGPPVPSASGTIPIDHTLIADKEIKVVGARCGSVSEGIRAIASGGIDLSGLITKRYRFDDAISALRSASDPDQIGVLVVMD